MNDWLTTALDLIEQGQAAILVSVVGTRGSAPRDSGTRMIVCEDHCHGTIGGGHLEYKATALAREQLKKVQLGAAQTDGPVGESGMPTAAATIHRFPLGASLGQCCGGLVNLLFEPLNSEAAQWLHFLRTQHEAERPVMMITQAVADTREKNRIAAIRKLLVTEADHHGELANIQEVALHSARQQLNSGTTLPASMDRSLWFEKLLPNDFRILIFGAGHVGKALVNVLATLPCQIDWIDSRAAEFPASMPANVYSIVTEEPELELAAAPAGSYVLILTHNHALDEFICAQALQNETLAWCGLIGSATKRRKFIQRFQARGMSDAAIARLTCPIGLPEFDGKHPGEIAVSVAAQILGLRQQQAARPHASAKATTQHEFA